MSKRAEQMAMDAWAIYEYREHPKGLYHTCFVDGYKEGYEQAEKDTIERAVNVLINLPSLVIPSNYIAYFRKKMLEDE